MAVQTKNNYVFPTTGTEEEQFQYIGDMMDDIEAMLFNELIFKIDINFNKQWSVEVFEHADDDEESYDGLELVDWCTVDTLNDVFNYLTQRYV